jgi:hypothetical protein
MINHALLSGGLVRKGPVETVHPLVRVHPVTGEKCLFINGEFITNIQGLKEPEFRLMTDFLMQHMVAGHDFQARIKWQPRTIVMFDNRSTMRKYTPVCVERFDRSRLTIFQTRRWSTTLTKSMVRNHATSSDFAPWARSPLRCLAKSDYFFSLTFPFALLNGVTTRLWVGGTAFIIDLSIWISYMMTQMPQ